MPRTTISLEDRFAIYDLLGAYVWALDTGDVEGVVNVFTKDAVSRDTRGNEFEGEEGIRAFATKFISMPAFRGRQHYVEHLKIEEAEGGGYKVTSYWTVLQWIYEHDVKKIVANGWSEDICVKVDGEWLIKARLLDYWSDQHGPWIGVK